MVNVVEVENEYSFFFLWMDELKIISFGYCESLEPVPAPAARLPPPLHLPRCRLLDCVLEYSLM